MIYADVPITYYAVFDGHGGAECALYLKENLHHELRKKLQVNLDAVKDAEDINDVISTSINQAFEETD